MHGLAIKKQIVDVHKMYYVRICLYYPELVLFDQSNYIDWIFLCYARPLTEIYSPSDTSVTCYLLRFENLIEIQFTSY